MEAREKEERRGKHCFERFRKGDSGILRLMCRLGKRWCESGEMRSRHKGAVCLEGASAGTSVGPRVRSVWAQKKNDGSAEKRGQGSELENGRRRGYDGTWKRRAIEAAETGMPK